jgi:hypothetical protein
MKKSAVDKLLQLIGYAKRHWSHFACQPKTKNASGNTAGNVLLFWVANLWKVAKS